MPIKVEAAVVTQKKQNTPFNTDSVNINGKLLPHEVIQTGYKGTGVMEGSVYFSISSSEIEGFADASVAAFNERAEAFANAASSPSDIITGYFKDSIYALGEMGHRSSELASSIMYASDSDVILAKTGNIQLYAYSRNGFAKVTPALFANVDGTSHYGICSFPSVAAGDVFLLVSPGVSQVLTDKDLDDICKAAEGSVKKIVNLIAKVTAMKQGEGGITAVAVKITEADAPADKPEFGFADAAEKYTENQDTDVPSVSVLEAPSDQLLTPDEPEKMNKGKKILIAILVVLVIVAVLGCAALAFKMFGGSIPQLFGKENETVVAPTTTEAISETTTKTPVTTTAPVTTTNPETTTSAVTTTVPRTTSAPVVTPTRSNNTSRYYEEEEEEENTTEEPTTEEEENTTEEQEQPTEAPSSEEQPTEPTQEATEGSAEGNSDEEVGG